MTQKSPSCVVAGIGDWGQNIVRTLHEERVLLGVVESGTHRADLIKKTYNIPVFSWAETLRNPGVDAVFLAVPSALHYGMALEALEAHKHVFIEKPSVKSTAQGQILLNLAREKNLLVFAGHLLMFHPLFQRLVSELKEDHHGPLHFVQSVRMNFGKFFVDDDILWDFGPHDFSMILALLKAQGFGDIATSPTFQINHPVPQRVDDLVEISLQWNPEMTARVHLSRLSPYKEQRLSLITDNSLFVFDDTLPWAEKLSLRPLKTPFSQGGRLQTLPSLPLTAEGASPLTRECQTFLEGMKTPSAFLPLFEEALQVISLIERIQEANRDIKRAQPPMPIRITPDT